MLARITFYFLCVMHYFYGLHDTLYVDFSLDLYFTLYYLRIRLIRLTLNLH